MISNNDRAAAMTVMKINDKTAAVIISIKTRHKKPSTRKRRKVIQETVIKTRIIVPKEQLLILMINAIIFSHIRHPHKKAAVDEESIPQGGNNE